ncbi:MAG: hypothetical protein H6745_19090 [Deltaproteobacteria bacterium]|nr:hypothetical protein [Deltaproteobacteria bacterium]
MRLHPRNRNRALVATRLSRALAALALCNLVASAAACGDDGGGSGTDTATAADTVDATTGDTGGGDDTLAADSTPDDTGAADASDGADTGPSCPDPATVDLTVTPTTAGDPDVLVGTFAVRLVTPTDGVAGSTAILGKVYDGPTPSPVGYEATDSEGDCQLLVPVVPFCATACAGGAICVADDTCQAYPTSQDLGAVTVVGVENAAGCDVFSMSPINKTYQPTGGTLPYPAFVEGDTLGIVTAGGAYDAFAITAKGVADLVITSTDLVVERDADIALTWEAGGEPSAVIDVRLDISHHGGTKGVLTCTTDDDGALTIPKALVTKLVDLGYAGLPTIVVTRHTTGSAVIAPGRVDLDVSAQVEQAVSIPGLVSCTDTAQCPDGETCQDDLTCQ